MYVDARRYNRNELTEEQLDFLQRLMPFGRLIQEMSWNKCQLVRIPSQHGLFASLAMSHILITSDWGTHPAALKENNLLLLLRNEYWKGKSAEVRGSVFRSYGSWLDFSIDFTDEITFAEKKTWEPVLRAGCLDTQLDNFLPENTTYSGRIEEMIGRYGLWEFDY